jgi:TolB-like protein
MNASTSGPNEDQRLDSWKAIANYLGKSVRTAKRWEAEEGLPVHRHMHQRQGTVHAFRREVDAWLKSRGLGPAAAIDDGDGEPRRGLLVLPFEHFGPDDSLAWLAAGVSEALTERLSRINGLRVLSRTSASTLAGRPADARTIGRRHGVEHLVEGSIRCDHRRLRISIRLIEVRNDAATWSESFDGTADDALDLQDHIAEQVARAMSGPQGRRLEIPPSDAEGPTSTAEWQCLVLARQAALRWRADALDAAVAQLQQGIEAMGPRPMLLAALGRTWLHYREAGLDSGPIPIRRARACADELADRKVRHPSRLQLEGWLRYADGNIRGAIRALEQAEALQPDDPETLSLMSNCLLISDRLDEARPRIERLLSIDPLTPLTVCLPGWCRLLEGRFEEALPHYRRMHAMDDRNPMAVLFLVYVLALSGRTAEIDTLFDSLDPDDGTATGWSPADRVARFLAAAVLDRSDAENWLDDSTERLVAASDMLPRFLASGYARMGRAEQALRWLDVAIEQGFTHYPFLAEREPLLEPLRARPEFGSLLERVHATWSRRLA